MVWDGMVDAIVSYMQSDFTLLKRAKYMKHLKQKYSFEKIGMDEVPNLEKNLRKIMAPLQKHLKNSVYWDDLELEKAEYSSRDGFIPHSHNCGGLMLNLHIPRCELYVFDFVNWDTDDTYCNHSGEPEGDNSNQCDDGHCDAFLSIWLKFEGLDEKGVGTFYLVVSAGTEDAPYFRNIPTIFETEFTAKTMIELQKNGSKAIAKLIKKLGGK